MFPNLAHKEIKFFPVLSEDSQVCKVVIAVLSVLGLLTMHLISHVPDSMDRIESLADNFGFLIVDSGYSGSVFATKK